MKDVKRYDNLLGAFADIDWREDSYTAQVNGQTLKIFRNGRTETTSKADAKLLSSRTIAKE
jgi:hypothetical protein